nr:mechanosensitive ion channel domain-containing protein [Sphingobium subterraneum]
MGEEVRLWLDANLIEMIIAIAAGTLIYLALRVARRQLRRLKNRPGDEHSFATVIGRTFTRTTHLFMILVSARLVAGYADPPALLLTTIRFLFTVVAVFQVAIWVREFILALIERRTGENGHAETLSNAMGIIRILVTVALFAIATVVVLDNLGVNVTGLVAGLGIGGIAIGLAAQGIFSDLFAALSIIFDKPFRRGETIQYDQTIATVERIGLKSTRLRALTGEKKIISNTNLLQKEISSFQELDHRRIALPFGVIYQTPSEVLETLPALLEEIVNAHGGRFVRSGITAYGASSIDFECLFDVYEPDFAHVAKTRHRIAVEILKRFADEKIEFAYPTQTSFTAAPDGRMIYPYPDLDGAYVTSIKSD